MSSGPDLFGDAVESALQDARPLAARMRPRSLDEVAGHAEHLGPEGFLRRAIAAASTLSGLSSPLSR